MGTGGLSDGAGESAPALNLEAKLGRRMLLPNEIRPRTLRKDDPSRWGVSLSSSRADSSTPNDLCGSEIRLARGVVIAHSAKDDVNGNEQIWTKSGPNSLPQMLMRLHHSGRTVSVLSGPV